MPSSCFDRRQKTSSSIAKNSCRQDDERWIDECLRGGIERIEGRRKRKNPARKNIFSSRRWHPVHVRGWDRKQKKAQDFFAFE
jgi:hypothetical protein